MKGVQEQERETDQDKGVVHPEIGDTFTQTRFVAVAGAQPELVGIAMRRLVPFDDAENADELVVTADKWRAQQCIDMLHSPKLRHHNKPAKPEEEAVAIENCFCIQLIERATKAELHEFVYISGRALDCKRHTS